MSLDLAALRAGYRGGDFSPAQIADDVLERIAAHDDPAVWIYRVPDADLRAAAAALAETPMDGLPLYGVPFAVKDNIDVAGMPTTAACPDFSYIAVETAPAVQRLLDAGALLIGKTNLDQFATGLVGVRTPYGVCRNALDPSCVPGGSSAGSGVAVAAGLVSFSLGTDTAGSGRVPAGFNNIVGVKPTKGLVSTRGVVPACRTLDCVSVFALTAEDGAAVRDTMSGFDAQDGYSRAAPAVEPSLAPHDVTGLRFGVPGGDHLKFFGDDAYEAAFRAACDRVVALGGTVVEIDFAPFAETAALLYDGPWVAERYVALREFLEKSPDSFHPVTRAIVENGTNYDAADVYAATYRLADLARRAEGVWDGIDAMLLPTSGSMYTVAEVEADPIRLNSNLGYYTNFVNLLDLAAIAVPAGFAANGRQRCLAGRYRRHPAPRRRPRDGGDRDCPAAGCGSRRRRRRSGGLRADRGQWRPYARFAPEQPADRTRRPVRTRRPDGCNLSPVFARGIFAGPSGNGADDGAGRRGVDRRRGLGIAAAECRRAPGADSCAPRARHAGT